MMKKIGSATVDSGLLYVGDPLSGMPNREKAIRLRGAGRLGRGVALPTGGDGVYPVYLRTQDTGKLSDRSLKKVIFDFTNDAKASNPNSSVRTIVVGVAAIAILTIIGKRV